MKLRKLKGKKKSPNTPVVSPARRGRPPTPKNFVPYFEEDDYETEREVHLFFACFFQTFYRLGLNLRILRNVHGISSETLRTSFTMWWQRHVLHTEKRRWENTVGMSSLDIPQILSVWRDSRLSTIFCHIFILVGVLVILNLGQILPFGWKKSTAFVNEFWHCTILLSWSVFLFYFLSLLERDKNIPSSLLIFIFSGNMVVHVSCTTEEEKGANKLHRDERDISESYGVYLGNFRGASLHCYDDDGTSELGVISEPYKLFR